MEGYAGPEGFGQDVYRPKAYFYADESLIASTWSASIQREFDVLMELFDWVLLRKNLGKTVSMACDPYRKIGGHYAEAYGFRMTGKGLTNS